MTTPEGLHWLTSPELERLLVAAEGGKLSVPLVPAELLAAGFRAAEILSVLAGLDGPAAARVLRALLFDRAARPAPHLDLVWTGPETRVATSRDTAVLVRELFASARASVLIAGFAFDHGRDLFEALAGVMHAHGVTTEIYLDIREQAAPGVPIAAHVEEYVARFLAENWPFGPPLPALFYDPRTAQPGARASLHAKCIVVDLARTLITSANFTDRGQTRNIELGVLIEDPDFASRVAAQWRSLAEAGVLERATLAC